MKIQQKITDIYNASIFFASANGMRGVTRVSRESKIVRGVDFRVRHLVSPPDHPAVRFLPIVPWLLPGLSRRVNLGINEQEVVDPFLRTKPRRRFFH